MKIRAYVDGLNLYYGGRQLAHGVPGWKWLDLRALLESVVQAHWPGATLDRVVYCTTRIDSLPTSTARRSQDVFLLALKAYGAVDWIEFGSFYSKTKTRPIAKAGKPPKYRPEIVRSGPPIQVRDGADLNVPDAYFMATVADREEKGSDVNVASHLLIDALSGLIDGAVVVSNDSDLAFPVSEVRKRMVVGVVNPHGGHTAGSLYKLPVGAVPEQWCASLTFADLTAHQLPDPCGRYPKPATW
jgi:hypothetical protein